MSKKDIFYELLSDSEREKYARGLSLGSVDENGRYTVLRGKKALRKLERNVSDLAVAEPYDHERWQTAILEFAVATRNTVIVNHIRRGGTMGAILAINYK